MKILKVNNEIWEQVWNQTMKELNENQKEI